MTLVQRVFAYLDERGIVAALIGGMALAFHGISRATYDSDLLLTDRKVLEPEFWRAWHVGGVPEIRAGDLDDPLVGVVSIRDRDAAVDLVVGREPWMVGVLDRRLRVQIGDASTPVADCADLILLKLYAAGPQDLLDVRLLIAARPEIRLQVESRLVDMPVAIRTTWGQIGLASS